MSHPGPAAYWCTTCACEAVTLTTLEQSWRLSGSQPVSFQAKILYAAQLPPGQVLGSCSLCQVVGGRRGEGRDRNVPD